MFECIDMWNYLRENKYQCIAVQRPIPHDNGFMVYIKGLWSDVDPTLLEDAPLTTFFKSFDNNIKEIKVQPDTQLASVKNVILVW